MNILKIQLFLNKTNKQTKKKTPEDRAQKGGEMGMEILAEERIYHFKLRKLVSLTCFIISYGPLFDFSYKQFK